METTHRVVFGSASNMVGFQDGSVDLIVTSPPYPMIEMWDDVFGEQDPRVRTCLDEEDGEAAFQAMHEIFDGVWRECQRVLRPGGFACINIGDATRKIGDNFRLYTNHVRITQACEAIGFQSLPPILWRKQTNGPNKFMGSGMLPSGAYVTLEHEYILIFRKGNKRSFSPDEGLADEKVPCSGRTKPMVLRCLGLQGGAPGAWNRRGPRGSSPSGPNSGANAGPNRAPNGGANAGPNRAPNHGPHKKRRFPFELVFRLVNMYSLQGDTVLDPFVGTGTTLAAAMASGRNSVGIEIDESFSETIDTVVGDFIPTIRERQIKRYRDHLEFVRRYSETSEKSLKYENSPHRFPVMTRQETDLELLIPESLERIDACHYLVRLGEYGDGAETASVAVAGFEAVNPGHINVDTLL